MSTKLENYLCNSVPRKPLKMKKMSTNLGSTKEEKTVSKHTFNPSFIPASQSILYEEAKTNDPNEIEFSELSDETFAKLRAKMIRNGEKTLNQPLKNSRSWMTKGSTQLFSK